MTRTSVWMLAGALGAAAAGCGSSSSSNDNGGGQTTQGTGSGFTITIHDMAFSPEPLAVPPGATVTVVNMDGSMPHSVTSESSDDAFTKGAASGVQFDTGAFTGQATFTIPANAPAQARIPYFCTVHTRGMATPNGHLVIDPTAQPAGTTGTSGTTGTGSGGTTGTGMGGY